MESVYHIGIVQTIFAALLISLKSDRNTADKILSLWLIVIALELCHSLLNFYHFSSLPDLVIFPLAYGPLIYLYTHFLVKPNTRLSVKMGYHFIPLAIFIFLPVFWGSPISIQTNDFFERGTETYLGMVNFLVFLLSIVYYFTITLQLIKTHKNNLSNQFSYENESNTLNWLWITTLALFVTLLIDELLQLLFALLNINPFNPVLLFHIATILFSFSISFFGFRQPNIFAEHIFNREKKNRDTVLDDTSSEEELAKKLMNLMKNQRPYLNQELTLQEVANQLNIPSHQLSKTINHYFKKNFFSLINEFRIEEAKKRMLLKEYDNLTLLAVAFDSGFNSKSSFNELFKKHCGMTPSTYKKTHKVPQTQK